MQSCLYLILETFNGTSQCNRRVIKVIKCTEIKSRDTGNRQYQFKHPVTVHKQRSGAQKYLWSIYLFICTVLK